MAIITLASNGERIHVEDGETILSGLFKAGFAYTVGCRRGGCGVCKVDVTEGSITHNRPVADSVITPEELSCGTCLSCRAVPDQDVTIRMRDRSLRIINPLLRQINDKARERAEAGSTAPKEL